MATEGITAAALRCLDSGDHSDLTIKCNDREFKVHKFALCPQSTFFSKAIKKDAFQEGQTSIISMDQDDPDAIEAMLKFLYTGDYNTENLTMQNHLEIYELADRVDIPALKTLCEDRFNAMAKQDWKDASFPACVKIAYDITPPGPAGQRLRSMLVKIASQHVKELFQLDASFKQMLAEVAEFGADMLEFLTKSPVPSCNDRTESSLCIEYEDDEMESSVSKRRYHCDNCYALFTITVRWGPDINCPCCGSGIHC